MKSHLVKWKNNKIIPSHGNHVPSIALPYQLSSLGPSLPKDNKINKKFLESSTKSVILSPHSGQKSVGLELKDSFTGKEIMPQLKS